MILNSYIYLGDDSDCETCGSSYNTIEYAYDTEDKQHELAISVGCHGGELVQSKIPGELINTLARYRTQYPGAVDQLNDLIRWLSR